jgi:hypothetical protein
MSLGRLQSAKQILSYGFCFRRSVLEQHKADGLDRVGPVKWSLALCVLAVFVLVYFSLWKGVRSTGKVSVFQLLCVCFTTLPFIIL